MTRRVARTALDQVRTAVWQLHRDLKSYQAEPTAQAQQMLEDRFDALCATRTCFTSLNLALKRMHRNKAELLLILERPVLALHNNLNEGDIREYVKRRKAACPPADDRRTEDGSGRSASSAPILPRFPSGRRSAYRRIPPIPIEVLGTARGRVYTPEELARHFAQAVVPRTTNRYGCVTLHSYHFYVEEGLPQTRVLLWVAGERLRAAFEQVILAEYHCRYDWRDRKVRDIREGVFHHTRYASPQRALIPLTPQETLVIYRARASRRQGPRLAPSRQLLLFELVQQA